MSKPTNRRLEQLRDVLCDGGLDGVMDLIGNGPIDQVTEDYLRDHVKAWDVFVYLTRWGKLPIATPEGRPVATPVVMATMMASLGFAMGPRAREVLNNDIQGRVGRLDTHRQHNSEDVTYNSPRTRVVIPTLDVGQVAVRFVLPKSEDEVYIYLASTFGEVIEIVTKPGPPDHIEKTIANAGIAYRTYNVEKLTSLILRSDSHVGVAWAILHGPGINVENITDWNGDEPW